ncbi:heavy metal translocating P-type ATPase [Propionivibrio limicola]|uniref:heavy metal translocating P-type ATPase n=1 Tax=Propionivibrio limicola TaxID=167645 RepID=UPI001FE781E0|nr:heavy metal translocating P-type ATPase [Propionivibrio limicola]
MDKPLPADARRWRCRIDNMDCPTEERLIRGRLASMPGIVRLDFNLLDRELTVLHRLDEVQPVVDALLSIGMAPRVLDGVSAPPPLPTLAGRQKLLLALSGAAATAAEAWAWVFGEETAWPVIALAAFSILCTGLPTVRKGWIALRHFTLNIYFLMTLAVAGALIIGRWPEAAMVLFLFAVAEAIEGLALDRARAAIKSLTAMAPETAEVVVDGRWQVRPISDVAVGARIRLRAGARVPLDARVDSGHVVLDQSPVTGESVPVEKIAGETVYAGCLIVDGSGEATVLADVGHSTLARIAAAIQEAQAQRAPTQRFVDRFAHFYTPAVVLLAIAVAVLGPWVSGGSWREWFYQALVMLVIACPCALVVSTPVTVVSGLAAAARRGILIKGGVFLESGRLMKAVAFDKTGTLTKGAPVLVDVVLSGNAVDSLTRRDALRIAASLADHSTHPVAQAILAGWRLQAGGDELLPVERFEVVPGRGVAGYIDGVRWQLGNQVAVLLSAVESLQASGNTVAVLASAVGDEVLFAVADTVRAESAEAVAALKAQGVHPVVLTGDNEVVGKSIARPLGIDDIRAGLLPEDKHAAVAELHARYGFVGMVGDGINDAPALARADIGIAMGAAGTATALETADVAIMDDDLRKVAEFIGLSQQTCRVLAQNIVLALGIKAVFLALAAGGVATLWMAVFADVGASLLVVFNGLRLARSQAGPERTKRLKSSAAR